MTNKSFFTNFEESLILQRLWNFIAQNQIIRIKGLLGSSLSFYCSTIIKKSLNPKESLIIDTNEITKKSDNVEFCWYIAKCSRPDLTAYSVHGNITSGNFSGEHNF